MMKLLIALLVTSAFAQELTPGYVLGVDDQITVKVLDLDEINDKLDKPIRVDMRGNIMLPLVGRLTVSGKTVEEVEAAIAARLKSVLKDPVVTVAVAEMRPHPVSVLGAVRSPGVHQIRGPKTLSEILSLAGGISQEAGNTIKITRQQPDGTYGVTEVSIKSLMDAKNPKDNVQILANDVVTVPKGELVYVVGAVKKSGGFVLNERESLTILQILAMADGLDPFASKKEARILRPREGSNDKDEIRVDLTPLMAGKAQDVPLKANDVLFVPTSSGRRAMTRAAEAAISLGTGLAIYRR